jgi:hypothetical protein
MAADFTPTPVPDQPPSFLVSCIALGLRAGLIAIGGWLIHSGVIDKVQNDALVQWGLGATVIITPIVWSMIEKYTKIKQIAGLLALLGKFS